MAKISKLPALDNPTGRETVPVVVGDTTMRASLSQLAEGAVAPTKALVDRLLRTRANIDPGVNQAGTLMDAKTGAIISAPQRNGKLLVPAGLDRRSGKRRLAVPVELDGLIDGEVDETTGALIWGIDRKRGLFTPQSDYAEWVRRGWANLRDPVKYKTMAIALTSGRSNGADALDFGQLQRPGAPMGVYPSGYAGPQDTYNITRVTDPGIFSQFGNHSGEDNLVNIGSPDGQVQYGIWETYLATESKLRGFALRMRKKYPNLLWALSQAFAEGGKSLMFLDRPTDAQIVAGIMPTQADGDVIIPKTSAEYRLLKAGLPMSELWRFSAVECATRFYKGARALSAMVRTAMLQKGLRTLVAMMIVSHAEPDKETNEYGAAFRRYVFNLCRVIKEITGQDVDPMFSVTITALSNDGDEQARSNETAGRVLRALEATADLPWVHPGYTVAFRSNRIHRDPWTMREEGEYNAELCDDIVMKGLSRRKGLRIVGHQIYDGRIILTTDAPFGEDLALAMPSSTGSHMSRNGMPYGLEYEAKNGFDKDGNQLWALQPMALADVSFDRRRIIYKPPVVPVIGQHRSSYNFGARAGSFVTDAASSATTNSTWYGDVPNQLHHRMLPDRRPI